MALNDPIPLRMFEVTLKRWWWVALLMITGGILASFLRFFQPPIYESKASFMISINYSETGQLSQFEEDYAVGTAANLIISTQAIEQVSQDLKAYGIELSPLELKKVYILERKQQMWDLRIRDTDPQKAATIASVWAERGFNLITEAHAHARRARIYQQHQNTLSNCLKVSNYSRSEICEGLNPDDLEAGLLEIETLVKEELSASRGVIPSLLIDLPHLPEVPEQPMSRLTNQLTLSGALIGLLAGIFLTQMNKK